MRVASRLVPAIPLIAGLLLTTGGAAVAAPVTPAFTITADNAAAVPAGHKWAFNDYFPRTATVAQGTTIAFANQGFHTATLLPPSWSPSADLDVNGAISADIDDSHLNPNGATPSQENIPPLMPVAPGGCGGADKPCVFDGSSVISMGAPLAGPPAPFLVTITAAPGTYAFHCRIHPGMQGTLTVVAAGGTGVTTEASAKAASDAQAAEDVSAGMAAEAAVSKSAMKKNKDGTRTWTVAVGTSDPAGHVVVLDMLPRKLDIKPGDAVIFKAYAVNEPHTVTFPGAIHTDAIPMCEGPNGKDVPATPTVIPPTGPQDFACDGGPVHEFAFAPGNGVSRITSPKTVADSGLVATQAEALAFNMPVTTVLTAWTASFKGAKKGTYTYVCQIHDGMTGTVVVH